jgi:hypothetical protein
MPNPIGQVPLLWLATWEGQVSNRAGPPAEPPGDGVQPQRPSPLKRPGAAARSPGRTPDTDSPGQDSAPCATEPEPSPRRRTHRPSRQRFYPE